MSQEWFLACITSSVWASAMLAKGEGALSVAALFSAGLVVGWFLGRVGRILGIVINGD